jgi:hypothetical protein
MVSHQDGEVDAGVIFSLAEIAKDSQGLWNRVTGAQYVRMFYSTVSQFTSKKTSCETELCSASCDPLKLLNYD